MIAQTSSDSPPNTFFFFADPYAANFQLGTSYFHSFSVKYTIITYQSYTKQITPYSWSCHAILWSEKIRSRPPKIDFLTLFTEEALLEQMQIAAGRDASPAYVTAGSACASRYSLFYELHPSHPQIRVTPTSPYTRHIVENLQQSWQAGSVSS